jgi:hypothetical protein
LRRQKVLRILKELFQKFLKPPEDKKAAGGSPEAKESRLYKK